MTVNNRSDLQVLVLALLALGWGACEGRIVSSDPSPGAGDAGGGSAGTDADLTGTGGSSGAGNQGGGGSVGSAGTGGGDQGGAGGGGPAGGGNGTDSGGSGSGSGSGSAMPTCRTGLITEGRSCPYYGLTCAPSDANGTVCSCLKGIGTTRWTCGATACPATPQPSAACDFSEPCEYERAGATPLACTCTQGASGGTWQCDDSP
jgi:hypothetical protein